MGKLGSVFSIAHPLWRHGPPPPSSSSGPDPRIHSVMVPNGLQRGRITAWILGSEAEDDENREMCTKNPCHIFPTLRPHATLSVLPLPDGSRTFRAKWEGMPLAGRANVGAPGGGGDGQRGSAGGALSQRRQHLPATGPGSAPARACGWGRDPRVRACGGHGACFARQGPCRNLRPKQFPRSVRTAAGATRAEGPEEGR